MKKIITIIIIAFLTIISFNSCKSKYDKISPDDYVLSPDGLTLLQWFKKDVKGIDFQSDPVLSKITAINDTLFLGYSSLKNVILPKGITEIKFKTFANSGLENIALTDNITTIGSSAFQGCASLTIVTIPNNVTTIEASAFEGCTSLNTITVPNSVTKIEGRAFAHCKSLKSISFPENITKISYSTFEGCSSLISFSVPNNVTRIEAGAFAKCDNLTSIEIPEGVELLGINNSFKFDEKVISSYIDNPSPSLGVFEECNSLVSIKLPRTITQIGDGAFSNCKKLTFITFESLVPPLVISDDTSHSLIEDSPIQAIYVPTISVNNYKNNFTSYNPRYMGYVIDYSKKCTTYKSKEYAGKIEYNEITNTVSYKGFSRNNKKYFRDQEGNVYYWETRTICPERWCYECAYNKIHLKCITPNPKSSNEPVFDIYTIDSIMKFYIPNDMKCENSYIKNENNILEISPSDGKVVFYSKKTGEYAKIIIELNKNTIKSTYDSNNTEIENELKENINIIHWGETRRMIVGKVKILYIDYEREPLVKEGSNVIESKCFFFYENKVVELTFFCDKSIVKYWKPLFAKVANDFYIIDK